MGVTATAPGSVTTVFAPGEGSTSLGVSFATEDGATVHVESAPDTVVFLEGERARVAPVSGVLRRLGATAEVRIEPHVPIGCGFGVSGAATLATALAVNEEEGLEYDRESLVEASHRAEVEAGTGLGDVFIQNQGGLVWDRGNGRKRTECTGRIEYASFGGISTADVLGDEDALRTVERVGRDVLSHLDPTDGLVSLFESSWAFATRTSLSTNRIDEGVSAVQAAGGAATMAMIGETVVAVGKEGVLDESTRITNSGAALWY